MPLSKAEIVVLETSSGKKETIKCMINPAEYSIRRNVKYAKKSKPGKDEADYQYLYGDGTELTVSLYFDTTGGVKMLESVQQSVTQEPVSNYTKKIERLTQCFGELHRPPKIAFLWGNLHFTGLLSSFSQTFNMFGMSGIPLRAKLDLTICGIDDGTSQQKSPFCSPDRTKYRTITQGMTLWQIAHDEYGDCDKWKLIAETNHIMNPFDVTPGQTVIIPAITLG